MEFQELENIIHKALSSINQNQDSLLLVFSGNSRYLIEKFFIEAREIGKKRPVKIAVDKAAQRFVTESHVSDIQGLVKVYCCGGDIEIDDVLTGVNTVVLGSLDIGGASKIAGLFTESLSEKIASEAFIRGLRIVGSSFINEETKSRSYLTAMKKLKTDLEAFGMEFIKVEDFKSLFSKDKDTADSTAVQKVITESFVKGLNTKELRIDAETILTPLAKDAIRERKINLTRGK